MKPVTRSIVILLLFCYGGLTTAQTYDGGFTTLETMRVPRDQPEKPLDAATLADPQFKLTARMVVGHSNYVGNHEYRGGGRLVVEASKRPYDFRYSCAYSFVAQNQTYPARWIVPDRKLEILMARPDSSKVKRCKVTTKPAPLQ